MRLDQFYLALGIITIKVKIISFSILLLIIQKNYINNIYY